MVQAGVRKILNDVIDGESTVSYYNVGAAANMYPGSLVIKQATDYDIEVSAADGIVIGWLGYGACNATDKPATRDTIYVVEAEAPVHSKAKYVRAIYDTAADVAKGATLSADGDGAVITGAVGTKDIVAIAAESVLSGATRIWVESRI